MIGGLAGKAARRYFPRVASVHTWRGNTANGSEFIVPIPETVNPGQMLVCFFSCREDPTHSPSVGWTMLGRRTAGSYLSSSVYWKIATGEDALVITINESQAGAAILYVIDGANTVFSASAGSSTAVSNAPIPALTPGSGNRFLYLALAALDGSTVPTAAPSGFTGLTSVFGFVSSQPVAASAVKTLQQGALSSANFTNVFTWYSTWTVAVTRI